jgi:hypothetical protein
MTGAATGEELVANAGTVKEAVLQELARAGCAAQPWLTLGGVVIPVEPAGGARSQENRILDYG